MPFELITITTVWIMYHIPYTFTAILTTCEGEVVECIIGDGKCLLTFERFRQAETHKTELYTYS